VVLNRQLKTIVEQAGGSYPMGIYPNAVLFYPKQLEKFTELILLYSLGNLEFHGHDEAISQIKWHAENKYGIKL
jgi:hypothetical protein